MNVFVPQRPGPFATLYLLHGLGNDFATWARRTRLETHLETLGLPLLIVMPDGGQGFFADARAGFAYESSFVEDLIPFVESTFQTSGKRAIGGFSMGGYGAIKLALKYPSLFVSAHSHAGPLDIGALYDCYDAMRPALGRIFGGSPRGGADDLFVLAQNSDAKPALRFDCGTRDATLGGVLRRANADFHAHLDKLSYAHEYETPDGAHDWNYCNRQIVPAIQFHARHLF